MTQEQRDSQEATELSDVYLVLTGLTEAFSSSENNLAYCQIFGSPVVLLLGGTAVLCKQFSTLKGYMLRADQLSARLPPPQVHRL